VAFSPENEGSNGAISDTINSKMAAILKTSNGHKSATHHPIHFLFGSSVGFSGTAVPIESAFATSC